MSERLIVRNFGPIQEIEIDLKKVTLLIGPQAAGKSTLAKLAAIFSSNQALKTALKEGNEITFS